MRSMATRAAASAVLVSTQFVNTLDTVSLCVNWVLRHRNHTGEQNHEDY